ncbi:MAG TPA: helix-turn-helix transcriptional regulator [Actinomycetota bacterium]|nr:helix-turn-helix transcriptional regulator [Actinomycetota bacterium]
MPAMYLTWLVRDRERFGFTAAQVAGRLGVTRQEYFELEAGIRWPSSTAGSGWSRCTAGLREEAASSREARSVDLSAVR